MTLQYWKQPKCPSTENGLNKLVYICTLKYHTAVKEKKVNDDLSLCINMEESPRYIISCKKQGREHV